MPPLVINKTYKDGDILFALDLDNICDSVEDFLNGPNLDSTNVSSSVLEALFLPGMLLMFGSITPPTGWLECDGSEISITTYGSLYTIIGTAFNTGGESAGNFRLPNFARRAPMGLGGIQGSPDAPDITLGSSGGEETHVLVTGELPAHTHTENGTHFHPQRSSSTSNLTPSAGPPWYPLWLNQASGGVTTNGTILSAVATVPDTATEGSDTAHNNIQPSLVSCFIIKT